MGGNVRDYFKGSDRTPSKTQDGADVGYDIEEKSGLYCPHCGENGVRSNDSYCCYCGGKLEGTFK